MENLISLFETAQDSNRIFKSRLFYHNRLEAPFQSGVFLNVLSVFIKRCRTYAMQLSPRQHGLQYIARVHSAVRLARAYYQMQLVDKQYYLAVALFYLC